MRELQQLVIDKTKIINQKQVEKGKRLVAILKPKPGQICYELDLNTGFIQPAVFKTERIQLVERKNLVTGEKILVPKKIRQIDFRPGYLYQVAINEKNAARKFIKVLNDL